MKTEKSPNNFESYLSVCKLSKTAVLPTKATSMSAGYDLYADENVVVLPRNKAVVSIGIKIEVPYGTYGRIAPRSGLASNKHVDIGAGVIDADYNGIVKVVIFNHSDKRFYVKVGDRIAQLICEKIEYPKVIEVVEIEPFNNSERQTSGFGSTGIK